MFWQRYLELCNSVEKAPNVVASEVGVKSSGTVTGWKNGALPRQSVLIKLSNYFGVTISDLTGEADQKEISPAPEGAELIPGYSDLTEENKAKVRDYIALLAMSEQQD